jgi:hypothetical protein
LDAWTHIGAHLEVGYKHYGILIYFCQPIQQFFDAQFVQLKFLEGTCYMAETSNKLTKLTGVSTWDVCSKQVNLG